ncbi:MAG: HAD family hydrolase [Bacteroidetes bacterium]|nr:HAD family hydrolase [Bacteroidota bacterium]
MNRAVFIDRDGTINIDKDYLADPDDIDLIEGSSDAIKIANALGLKVVVISNQSGVSRGIMTAEQVDSVNSRLVEMLKYSGARVDAVYYCPHHPNYGEKVNCACRKPGIGMLLRAKSEFGLDLGGSFVVGDKWSDVKCGENAGALTSLVRTGYGESDYQRCIDGGIKIDYLAENLFDSVTNFIRKKIETDN